LVNSKHVLDGALLKQSGTVQYGPELSRHHVHMAAVGRHTLRLFTKQAVARHLQAACSAELSIT
jgi:hypothetical protein